MSDCKDCVKGHCDRWDHLVGKEDGVEKPPLIIPYDPVAIALAAMDDSEVQCSPIILMSDEAVRCACGGTFVYNAGRMRCNLCEAPFAFNGTTTVSAESEVGLSLDEVLRRRRRRVAPRWVPSEADVKVS